MKKSFSILLSIIIISCTLVPSNAAVTLMNISQTAGHIQFIDDEDITGTVCISLSINGEYAQSDITGEYIARMPIKLKDVAQSVCLDQYGYRDLIFDLTEYNKSFSGREPITLLHIFIYFLENYHPDGWNVELTGSSGSTYMQSGFWGRDENLTYYVNGEYPLDNAGFGATSDHIILEDGDFIDIQMYDDFDFWNSPDAGYRYFLDTYDGSIVNEYTMTEGDTLPVYVGRTWNSLSDGDDSVFTYDNDRTVELADELYDYPDKNHRSFNLNNGTALISGVSAGEWTLWTDGDDVSAPGCAKLIVKHDLENGVCTVCGFKDETVHCDHLCHKTGFMGSLWKIINFFNKLFRINQICKCNEKHYG